MTEQVTAKSNRWLVIVLGLFVLVELFIAYQPVLFNYFCSDDFYIVSWLSRCKDKPALLFQTVYEGTPYYRPMLNVFLFLEFLLGGANGLFFRFTSLFYLFITGLLFWLILKKIANRITKNSENEEVKNQTTDWCLFSMGLFLLYPLHTEPINWFVCTTELLVNIFILASFWLYIKWREKKKLLLAGLSCVLAALAFLTKEIAVILPALLFLYEFIFADIPNENTAAENADLADSKSKKFTSKLLSAIKFTAIYWLLMAAYLCLRKLMIGNFLGNWSNTVFHFSDNQTMYKAWLQSLKMIVMPLSSAVFDHQYLAYFVWMLVVLGLTILSIVAFWHKRNSLILAIFFIGWFFISLLPMAKLLWITPDMLDARYGYIASIPLCALLMYGLAFVSQSKLLNKLRYPIFVLIIGYSCFILRENNMAWAEAGQLTNGLLSEFSRIHKTIPDNENIYLVNMPIKFNGVAMAGIKVLESMNNKPFLDKAYRNCIWLNNDQSLPIGIMHQDIEEDKIHSHFYALNIADKHLYPVKFNSHIEIDPSIPRPKQQNLFVNINGNYMEADLLKGLGEPQNIFAAPPTFMWSKLALPCWGVDMLVLKVNIQYKNSSKRGSIVHAAFTNDITRDMPEAGEISMPLHSILLHSNKVHSSEVSSNEEEQFIVIPLRGNPNWSFGGICQSFLVSFPKNTVVADINAYACSMKSNMPKIKFDWNNYDSQTGQIKINQKNAEAIIDYDVYSQYNCEAVALEILKPGEYFNELNSGRSDGHSLIDLVSAGCKGKIILRRSMFKEPGVYKVRLRPLDKQHHQCGLCSDHFIVNVSN